MRKVIEISVNNLSVECLKTSLGSVVCFVSFFVSLRQKIGVNRFDMKTRSEYIALLQSRSDVLREHFGVHSLRLFLRKEIERDGIYVSIRQ